MHAPTKNSHDEYDLTVPEEVVTIMIEKDISWLAAYRTHAGLTWKKAAEASGISVSSYTEEELSERPSTELLDSVSKVLGAKPGVLYDLYYGEG